MGRIENKLKNVKIGGDYVGGNMSTNYYGNQTKKDIQENKAYKEDKTVFLSYNRQDKKIAEKIDKHLSDCGITVKRDVRDISPWKSIREFMTSIRDQDYAVLIISDFYLKSENCMFEVTEIMKEQKYENRIFPVVEKTKIYEPSGRAEYINYWQQKCDEMEECIKEAKRENTTGLLETLRRYKNIASSMDEFLSMVADMNNPDIQDVEKKIAKAILGDL